MEEAMSAVVSLLNLPSLRDRVSAEEWNARVELAACYRLAHHFGWAGTNFGTHLSARVPSEPDHFLLNPVGLMFNEISASSLIKVDMDGKKLNDSPYRVNSAGITLHSGVYLGRADVNAVVHTHTKTGVAFSMLECGLLPLSTSAMRFHKRLGYWQYTGAGDDPNNRKSLAAGLGPHMAVVMKNHGLISVGRTVGESMVVMIVLEQAIEAQLMAMSTGAKLSIPDDEDLLDRTADKTQARIARNNSNDGNWQTLVRLADSLDPSYRQ
jgi:ribulose-5-phosphate 4-epimerase/fuculose-1-phosphate aldolase